MSENVRLAFPWQLDPAAAIHLAAFGGLPMRILVAVVGLVVTMPSLSGIYIWLRKRKARQQAVRRRLL
jgi:uncharacterized iron-regulated membrane protein